MTEKELLHLIESDKEQGFQALFNVYSQKIYNTIIHLVRDVQEAEELTQDCFMTIYDKIEGFNGQSKLSTWIYRISVNKSLDLIKSNKRKFRLQKIQSIFTDKPINVPSYNHPGIIAEQKELSQHLFRALATLPAKQQVAYTLSKIEGRSNKEVSNILDTTVSSVESLLIRAKANLKKELAHYYKNNFK